MSLNVLTIVTRPELPSNKRLEEEFRKEVFRRVKRRTRSKNPIFLFFRPCGRPKEEFICNIIPLLEEEKIVPDDVIFVTVTNNREGSHDYLDDVGYRFKVCDKLVLTEGDLDVTRNERSFQKITNVLIKEHNFKAYDDNEMDEEEHDKDLEQELEDMRKSFEAFDRQLCILVLGDKGSSFTNNLLSSLLGVQTISRSCNMVDAQVHAYRLGNHWIVNSGTPKNLIQVDICEALCLIDQISRNRHVCVVLLLQGGTTVPWHIGQLQKASKYLQEKSWHIVVTVEEDDKRLERKERERLNSLTGMSESRIHFIKESSVETHPNPITQHKHLTVLDNILKTCTQSEDTSGCLRTLLLIIGVPVLVAAAGVILAYRFIPSTVKDQLNYIKRTFDSYF